MKITGINTHVPSSSNLHKVVQLGLKHIRIDINWCDIEPKKGEYQFDAIDAVVQLASKDKLRIFATIAYSPKWIGGRTSVPSAKDWSLCVSTVAARYKGKIEAYGLWNEPNLSSYWSGTIKDYIDIILIPGFNAVKENDALALVVAPDIATIGRDWPLWLDAMSNNKNMFDILAVHNYEDSPERMFKVFYHGVKWKPLQFFFPKYRPIKQYIDKVGKRTWLCEMGWASNKFGVFGQLERYNKFIKSTILPVERIYAYELRDDPVARTFWGLYYADGTAKPATRAFE